MVSINACHISRNSLLLLLIRLFLSLSLSFSLREERDSPRHPNSCRSILKMDFIENSVKLTAFGRRPNGKFKIGNFYFPFFAQKFRFKFFLLEKKVNRKLIPTSDYRIVHLPELLNSYNRCNYLFREKITRNQFFLLSSLSSIPSIAMPMNMFHFRNVCKCRQLKSVFVWNVEQSNTKMKISSAFQSYKLEMFARFSAITSNAIYDIGCEIKFFFPTVRHTHTSVLRCYYYFSRSNNYCTILGKGIKNKNWKLSCSLFFILLSHVILSVLWKIIVAQGLLFSK